jgi:DNA-directed RNA polymerase specialized sigma24 family protein
MVQIGRMRNGIDLYWEQCSRIVDGIATSNRKTQRADRNDLSQSAYVSMLLAIDGYRSDCGVPIMAHIVRRVRTDLIQEMEKEDRRKKLRPTVSIDDLRGRALDDGDPLDWLDIPWSSPSLAARPDANRLLMDGDQDHPEGPITGIGEIRASASIQCAKHDPRNKGYEDSARASRFRIASGQATFPLVPTEPGDVLTLIHEAKGSLGTDMLAMVESFITQTPRGQKRMRGILQQAAFLLVCVAGLTEEKAGELIGVDQKTVNRYRRASEDAIARRR